MKYFSDREGSLRPLVGEELTDTSWGGIVALVTSLSSSGALGIDFPLQCQEYQGPIGTNEENLWLAIQADIPDLKLPLDSSTRQKTMVALDLIEFCHQHVSVPQQTTFHKFLGHYHLRFDREAGQNQFRDRVNTILSRNGLTYELQPDGQVLRLMPPIMREAIISGLPATSDSQLDSLLGTAIVKFKSPDLKVRQEALEKLWDAWERIKTLLNPSDKQSSSTALLDRAAVEPNLRATLESEARELTRIGNDFQIRHFETSKIPVTESAHVDYLFHRMFSFVLLLVKVL